jgi:para-aminobenzoate synthetase/4-amino-4-deoxychorismate lyase
VEQTPATVLLECSRPGASASSSRLFTAPSRVLAAFELVQLPNLFAQIESATAAGHFAAGFFSYECGEVFEPTVKMRPRPASQPLAWFGIYEKDYRFDHTAGSFAAGGPPGLIEALSQAPGTEDRNGNPGNPDPLEIDLSLSEREYAAAIRTIHEWIRAGDIYQLNFTFPLRVRIPGRAAALYARLRSGQPVEYGAFLHCLPGRQILSFSPELFFHLEEQDAVRHITTRPMKGTAPRGRTTAEDREIVEWLRNDAKNRSENVMIVDLLRNDVGRLCEFGSVRVENLFAVQRLPTLWQMTSTVTGDLRRNVSFCDIFRALFPCGSITGAPKVRAMQLLAQIEHEPRGVYSGAIGFFSREQTIFNVAIRTLELDGQDSTMGVGSGIVIDSNPADEFRECRLKAEFLSRTEQSFFLIETMLWNGGYPLIELHLDRLQDSAEYFGFACNRDAIKAALLAAAQEFRDAEPHKVRLLLDPAGCTHIEHEVLSKEVADAKPPRVSIAQHRTDSSDRMLFHKTTHRSRYARAFKAACEAGFCDVLFLNERGEVTEGAISNIFIEKAGRWLTSPIDCGLLPGVYRRHLLQTRPDVQEQILYLEDLKTADAIYLTNAVLGLRRMALPFETMGPLES